MHSLPLRLLRQCYASKLALKSQPNPRSRNICLTKTQCKMQTIVLDKENIPDMETIHSEQQSLSWLHSAAPGFPIDGSNVKIIYEPNVFYTTLLEKCKHAKKRITLASLYLGTSKLESDLVTAIQEAVNTSNGNLEVRILIDFMRGSRGKLNSCKMLEPLLHGKYSQCCNIFLYHTPKLRGLLKRTIPDRFNELIGLQHMKLYMIDNDLIISGANLSKDYFTNRQDRYVLIENCKDLCDFYDNLVKRVGEFSFMLRPDGSTELNPKTSLNPVKNSEEEFIRNAADNVRLLLDMELKKRQEINRMEKNADTWIFPLLEMGQLGIHHDSQTTLKLLKTASKGSVLRLATGYFNLTSEYTDALLRDSQATCHLLTAHPTANGFFNAKGIAGAIPAAYTRIEELFCKMCEKLGQENRITMWEFLKPGWTYHAKGLWYTLPGQSKPSLTLIGSPNFGYRSVHRDLETQIAIVTKNANLQNSLEEEHKRLFSLAKPVTKNTFSRKDRIPPSWVSAVVVLFRYYF